MSNKTIPEYDAAGSIDASTDQFLMWQNSTNTYKKINRNTILGTSGTPVDTTSVQTLQNKVLDNTNTITLKDTLFTLQDDGDTTKQAKFQLSGITTGTTRTYTLPNASSTLADIATAQTLTNKTLTAPVINNGSITGTTITTDAIVGQSAATTGTIYGASIVSGVIASAALNNTVNTAAIQNSAVTTAKINDSAVTPAKLLAGTGTSWPWQTWTPTLTNLSGGTQNYAKYVQIGKTVICRFKYTLAGAGVGSGVSFTLPVTASSEYVTSGEMFQGSVALIDAGINFYGGVVMWNSSTSVALRYQTGSTVNSLSSTAPFTWGTGDFLQCHFIYEAA